MKVHQERIQLRAARQGLHDVTPAIEAVVSRSQIQTGLCHVFLAHTSASLLIQENYDPSARRDLERYFDRLAPEGDPAYEHVAEGPDDMPAHLKTALTSVSEQIPVVGGRLGLGRWQGLYLFEHRRAAGERTVIVTVWGEGITTR